MEVELPEEVLEIVSEVTEEYEDDIGGAVDESEVRVKKLKSYRGIVRTLLRKGIRQLVHDFRHSANRDMKKAAGVYTGPGKVQVSTSKAVRQAAEDYYKFYIAGKTLGSVLGSELQEIADGEQEKANGRLFNVRLCTALVKVVPENKTVSEAVNPKKLDKIFKDCGAA